MATQNSLKLAKKLWDWEPHSDGQRDFLLDTAKVKSAACGRRWGKSEGLAVDIVLYALEFPHTIQIIIAPTDDQSKIIMQECSDRLHSIPGMDKCMAERHSPYWTIAFHDRGPKKNGVLATSILARTAGVTGKGLRGRKAHRVIVDEAAYVPDSIMDSVVTPLLADYNGDLILVSTPAGRNHFYFSWTRGKDALQRRYSAYQFPSACNPYLSAEYLENERATKPERVWQVEYLAQFLDDAGGVFRRVAEAIDPGRKNEPPEVGRHYYLGVDLARTQDFTVLSVVDSTGRQVYHERSNQIAWERQIESIKTVSARYNNAHTFLDSTGVGDPIFEQVRKAGVRCEGFQFTNSSKENLIDNLALMIEQGRARLLDLPVQTNELSIFQYELTPSRNVRMSAPPGEHDDCVISLALSYWGLRQRRQLKVL